MFGMIDLWVYYKGNPVSQITRPSWVGAFGYHYVEYAGHRCCVMGKPGLQYIEAVEMEGRKPWNSH